MLAAEKKGGNSIFCCLVVVAVHVLLRWCWQVVLHHLCAVLACLPAGKGREIYCAGMPAVGQCGWQRNDAFCGLARPPACLQDSAVNVRCAGMLGCRHACREKAGNQGQPSSCLCPAYVAVLLPPWMCAGLVPGCPRRSAIT